MDESFLRGHVEVTIPVDIQPDSLTVDEFIECVDGLNPALKNFIDEKLNDIFCLDMDFSFFQKLDKSYICQFDFCCTDSISYDTATYVLDMDNIVQFLNDFQSYVHENCLVELKFGSVFILDEHKSHKFKLLLS